MIFIASVLSWLVSVVYTCIVVSKHVGVQEWVFCPE